VDRLGQPPEVNLMIPLMFSRRWWTTTILVLVGIGLTIRLGFWQVDRYRQNKAFADHLTAMQTAAPLLLGGGPSPVGLTDMEYRAVQATGTYDFAHQIAVRNQVWVQSWGNETGYILVTPLVFPDGLAVLVDRGWIPLENNTRAAWGQFDVTGPVVVTGIIRLPAVLEMGGEADPTLAPAQVSLDIWNLIDLDRLKKQIPYPLLPVYIQQTPVGDNSGPPFRSLSNPDLTAAGTNVGYATMWFAFTALLIFGYPLYLRNQAAIRGLH
jgi:surfeit locus 1 family protein